MGRGGKNEDHLHGYPPRPWRSLGVPADELRVDVTLSCGQSFRWQQQANSRAGRAQGLGVVWTGVVDNFVVSLCEASNDTFFVCRNQYAFAKKQKNSGKARGNECEDPLRKGGNVWEFIGSGEYDSYTNQEGRVTPCKMPQEEEEEEEFHEYVRGVLWEYFNLRVSVAQLYKIWSDRDPVFRAVVGQDGEARETKGTANGAMAGIRILRQDPEENLFAFICSANNNIPRITGMVAMLCEAFGERIAWSNHPKDTFTTRRGRISLVDGDNHDDDNDDSSPAWTLEPIPDACCFAFPTLERFTAQPRRNGHEAVPVNEDGGKVFNAEDLEAFLREMKFGYRAKYIAQTVTILRGKMDSIEGGNEKEEKKRRNGRKSEWLRGLREMDYESARESLLMLAGVGPKVCDCICLMSMDKHGAIPVDTHVWQIAATSYLPELRCPAVIARSDEGHEAKGKNQDATAVKSEKKTVGTKKPSLTKKTYEKIGNFFRELHGEYAGWAHSVLFSADLKRFEDRVNIKLSTSKEMPGTGRSGACDENNNKKERPKLSEESTDKKRKKKTPKLSEEPANKKRKKKTLKTERVKKE
eukprot:Nk52_evm44s745 gene=Nk52_evmTU44s745